MLDHLHIQNYRLFKDLKIDKLGQVNLIAGKNNTGKTALLEAIRIWASDGDGSVVNNIVFNRGDWQINREVAMYSKFFFNSNYGDLMGSPVPFIINDIKAIIERLARPLYALFFETSSDRFTIDNGAVTGGISYDNPRDEVSYISISIENNDIVSFWKDISLTPAEKDVVKILKILLPNLSRIAVDDGKTKVLLENEQYPQPLKNFGDGANRLFFLALGLVKAKFVSKHIFLIDEFEVGLHHSVQKQLWEIIFKYAKEWNIQVFVTTHSQDTVKAFYSVSSKEEYNDMGQYMRLQKSKLNDEIEAVIYSKESLNYAIEDQLETR